jgi:hypothetical protein
VGAAVFGNTIDVTLGATIGGNTALTGASTLTGFNRQSTTRYELFWNAGERGKPGITADATSATPATLAGTDPLFEVTGTNSTSALCTRLSTGGLLLTTAAAAGDRMILGPHTTADLSPWKSTAWLTQNGVEWECVLKGGTDIVNSVIWAGLKLTSASAVSTDDDAVFFRYETVANGGAWLAHSSIATTDAVANSAVLFANDVSAHLKITIDGSRIAKFYVNGSLITTTGALTSAVSLIPFIGVEAVDAAAVSLGVRGQSISKTIS